ncbi:hypothetical protein L6R50_24575 [Myxococcota bacterium]|nr:hypothetical protein [Myxococcota bacterium]
MTHAGTDVLRVDITRFRDTTDTIPCAARLPYPEMVALLAPEHPPVRDDVTVRIWQQEARLAELERAALAGRRDMDHAWLRAMEKAAVRARGDGSGDAEVAVAIREKAASLRDELRKRAKGTLPCWTPAIYRPNTTRGAGSVEAVTGLVLDFDDGTGIDDAIAPWASWPLLVHTSWSHRRGHPRFRLVLVLDEPVPAAMWPRAWAWAWERSGGHADAACKDPSRLYLLPAVGAADAPWECRVHDPGGWLLRIDWERLPEPTPTVAPRPLPPVSRVRPFPRPLSERIEPARRKARAMLRSDRSTRERAAEYLGAHVVSNRAERIACPSCDRPSVWFYLDPGRQTTAVCDHRNSCAWWGHLDDLLDHHGKHHVR